MFCVLAHWGYPIFFMDFHEYANFGCISLTSDGSNCKLMGVTVLDFPKGNPSNYKC